MSGRQICTSRKVWYEVSGLQCIIGRFQTLSAIWKFSDVRESITAKQNDGLTSFLMLSVLEAKIFQYGFLEEHKICVNNHY